MHRRIFDVASQLIRAGKLASPITLKTFLGEHDLGGVTVPQYLARLAAEATTIINAEDYGRTIHDLALRRDLILIGEDIVNAAYDAPVGVSPREQIEEAERKLYSVAETGRYEGGFQRFSDALTTAVDMAAKAFERDGRLSGIATGLTDLDRYMGGLQPSDLIIVAGRPGMGKTALATNIAFNIARAHDSKPKPDGTEETVNGGIVGFFSLEMSAEQLSTRMLSSASKLNSSKITNGRISSEEFSHLVRVSQEMAALPFYIDDTPALSIAGLRTRARRLKRMHNLKVLVVDYLQLLRGHNSLAQNNRVQEVSEITQGLKAIAKDLDVPVLALSQLSRAVEQREDKKPLLSDLRESGSIEQDADIVMFIYREEYYLARMEPSMEDQTKYTKWQADMERVNHVAEVIVAKHRNGPIGNVKLRFDSDLTQFSNLAEGYS